MTGAAAGARERNARENAFEFAIGFPHLQSDTTTFARQGVDRHEYRDGAARRLLLVRSVVGP